jgi:hypothetical protein
MGSTVPDTRHHGAKNIPLLSLFKGILGQQRHHNAKYVAGNTKQDDSGGRRPRGRRVSAVDVDIPVLANPRSAPVPAHSIDFGYPRNLDARFEVLHEIARCGLPQLIDTVAYGRVQVYADSPLSVCAMILLQRWQWYRSSCGG